MIRAHRETNSSIESDNLFLIICTWCTLKYFWWDISFEIKTFNDVKCLWHPKNSCISFYFIFLFFVHYIPNVIFALSYWLLAIIAFLVKLVGRKLSILLIQTDWNDLSQVKIDKKSGLWPLKGNGNLETLENSVHCSKIYGPS